MTITMEAQQAELHALAPELADGYAAGLPRAVDVVGRRLLGAASTRAPGTARSAPEASRSP